MITDIANWLQVNIVNNPQVLTSLLALIILIVAGFLMSEKPTKKIFSKRILGAVLFVFAIFVFLNANIADLADVFTVWATLVLAGVAIFSFEESRRLREENRQREERERKDRLLNEITEWAIDVLDCNSLVKIEDMERRWDTSYQGGLYNPESVPLRALVNEWRNIFLSLCIKGESIAKHASSFVIAQDLHDSLENTIEPLLKQKNILERFPDSISWEGLRNNRAALDVAIRVVIDKSIEIQFAID